MHKKREEGEEARKKSKGDEMGETMKSIFENTKTNVALGTIMTFACWKQKNDYVVQ